MIVTYLWQTFAVVMSSVLIFIAATSGSWILGALTALAVRLNYKIFSTEADKRKLLLAKKRR